MQTVKGVKVRCIKLLKNKVYKFARYMNTYFGTTLTITDIWGTAGTTVKNLYSYFKNHLSLFEDIIEIKNREICIKPGVNANDIDKLLEIDKNIEKVDRKNLFAIYTEVSSCL